MKSRARFVLTASALLVAGGCSKGSDAVIRGEPGTLAISARPLQASDCAHAVCADNFFIDALPAACVAGSPCALTLKLVATGDFHINDEYPYRFKADDAPGVDFLGTDASGKSTFSKTAGDWQKSEEKAGAMTVKFAVADRGARTIAGNFKLSVCSAQACLLEQRQVAANVVTK
jgi:hypothetical protein